MSQLKTKPTGSEVMEYINAIADESRRKDCTTLMHIFGEVTGVEPDVGYKYSRVWGISLRIRQWS